MCTVHRAYTSFIFHHTPKRLTSVREPSLCHCACGNTASFEEKLQRWRAVGNTVFDLTSSRYEAQASRSRDERVTARPTGLLNLYLKLEIR